MQIAKVGLSAVLWAIQRAVVVFNLPKLSLCNGSECVWFNDSNKSLQIKSRVLLQVQV